MEVIAGVTCLLIKLASVPSAEALPTTVTSAQEAGQNYINVHQHSIPPVELGSVMNRDGLPVAEELPIAAAADTPERAMLPRSYSVW